MANEIELIKKQIKDNIHVLIDDNKLDDAMSLINQYFKIDSNDIEICSIKAVIFIMQGNLNEAEIVLKEGLAIDSENFDLNYNLGYLYSIKEDEVLAYSYYKYALNLCKDNQLINELKNILSSIKKKHTDIEKISNKKKIVFFDKGDDKFIWDIINELSKDYETKHIRVTDYSQIDEGMEWADICWFEWCDELVAYGSKHRLAKEKKIICRLHSYEAFAGYPDNVELNNVNKIIFVGNSIREFVIDKYNIDKEKTVVNSNGVNTNKYKFKERKYGFNIAYVGYINYKKGPMLLLHTFKAIYDKDNRYKLYIAGQFQDARDVLYFKQMIKEFGIDQNVFYEGWQDNLDLWLEDKSYILCTSVLESQNMSVMQAMSKGIKPIIHNFVEAKSIYSNKYVWNTIDEAVNMITKKEYDSIEYRNFIEDNYSFEKQINEIFNLIKSLEKNKTKSIYSFNYNEKKINFYLPYLNDYIQRVIYKTNNFYEVQMLEDIKRRIGINKVIIDVGANIGNHTVFFSTICKAKKVYSFEPQKNIFKILSSNVEINNMTNIVNLYNMGIGDSFGYANTEVVDENNYGMSKLQKDNEGVIEINTLDAMLLNKVECVDMIKIDVENMELEVLKGSSGILKKYKPLIYIEAATNEEFKVVEKFLNSFNYKAVQRFNATPTYLFM